MPLRCKPAPWLATTKLSVSLYRVACMKAYGAEEIWQLYKVEVETILDLVLLLVAHSAHDHQLGRYRFHSTTITTLSSWQACHIPGVGEEVIRT